MRISAIVIFITFLFTFFTGCGTVELEEPAASGADLEAVVSINPDLDGNGYDDALQSFVVAWTEEFGAVLFAKPGAQLPGGTADGQDLALYGYGNELYSNAENGWETEFFPMVPVYSAVDGALIWYGAGGLREGNYEVNCGMDTTDIGLLDGWCLPGAQETAADVHDILMTVKDGQEGCWREVTRWAFEVQDGWVDPLVTRLSDPDPNCYE